MRSESEFPDFYEFTAYDFRDFPKNSHSDDGYFREKLKKSYKT